MLRIAVVIPAFNERTNGGMLDLIGFFNAPWPPDVED